MKYAKIGDLVYHKWSCQADIPNMYCMKVHSCTVNDGQGGNPVYVLDQFGYKKILEIIFNYLNN